MKLFPSVFIILAFSPVVTAELSSDIAIAKTSIGPSGKWQLEADDDPTCGNPTPPPVTYQCCYYAYRLQSLCCYISTGKSWNKDVANKAGCLPPAGKELVATKEEWGEVSFLRGGDTDPSTRKPNFCIYPDFSCYKTSSGFPPCCLHYDNCPLSKPACHLDEEEAMTTTSVVGRVDVDDHHDHVQPEEMQWLEAYYDYTCGNPTPPPEPYQCCYYRLGVEDYCCYRSTGYSWTASGRNASGCIKPAGEELVANKEEPGEVSFLRSG